MMDHKMHIIIFSLICFLFLSSSQNVEPPPAAAAGGRRLRTRAAREGGRPPKAQITVMGFVYCDICSNNSFSRNSYFLPGAGVRIDCKMRANSPRTAEEITFSVNRTTNRHGVYRLEIPSVDGIECAGSESGIKSLCQATLISSSNSKCNLPGHKTTTDQVSFLSSKANLCIYSFNAMTFRPSPTTSKALCGN